ncbi:unnamed protein product [Rotaria sp. Silwood2]|nr:unnamed protein product [Rotaria sp. Silwood2]CAF2995321.1 unnamed protein product [Rotaria sp. Silwood2]CAF3163938.1 unnamed protein product [Rotaria sp. Silwood2]CAF3460610.1 unnamed protein product [Rotaria sp. Silwood2]CAF4501960.1 unnamed protein product [Rotaria sp. Silwood2]
MGGDILIHAGDLTDRGTHEELRSAFDWLLSLDNFTYKIFISGNMDGIGLDNSHLSNREQKRCTLFRNNKNVIYLENDSCEVFGIKIYGCPYTPKFYGGFQYPRQSVQAEMLWDRVPEDCDILISHGPPADFFDTNSRGVHVGCENLWNTISKRDRLKAIIFGHVHHSYGFKQKDNKWFINATQYNGIYQGDIRNQPFELYMQSWDKTVSQVTTAFIKDGPRESGLGKDICGGQPFFQNKHPTERNIIDAYLPEDNENF